MAMQAKVKEEVTIPKGNGQAAEKVDGQPVERRVTGLVNVVTAAELGSTQTHAVDVPDDLMEGFNDWLADYKVDLTNQTEKYVQYLIMEQRKKRSEVAPKIGDPKPATGTPGCPAGYVAFDVFSYSPIELSGPMIPHSPPNKVLMGTNPGVGNLTLATYFAVVFVNPVVSIPCGFAVAPAVQLAGLSLQVRFDAINLSTVATGPSGIVDLTFPSGVLAPVVTLVPFYFLVPSVTSAHVYELNVTADIVESPKPYSAFATFHADIDEDLFLIPTPPQLRHNEPNRFMIYPV